MKRIFILMLALSLVIGVMLTAVSCNENGNTPEDTEATTPKFTGISKDTTADTPNVDEKKTYTVTIKDDAGQPIAGVELQICIGDQCQKPQLTNSEGKATFKVSNPDNLELKLQVNGQNSTAGYTYPTDKIAVDAEETEISVTINKAA